MRIADLSPGWRTDFIALSRSSQVYEYDDCIAVCTPSQPSFYWGNFLLLGNPPADGDLPHWRNRFDAEVVARVPGVKHVAIGVDSNQPLPPLPAWQSDNYERTEHAVLLLNRGELLAPRKPPRVPAQIRPFDMARELDTIVALQSMEPGNYEPAGFAAHQRTHLEGIQAMADDGIAAWFGAFCEGQAVADCGLLRSAAKPHAIGRFRNVETHPAWRRRGLCTALVHSACTWGFEHWGLDSIVMCADPQDVAIGIYESLGFKRVGRSACLQRYAPEDAAVQQRT